jgi:hypothetical protein
MAKGLRSKRMRKNRSILRKNFAQPIVDKRQEKIAEDIRVELQEKRGETIKALKTVFGAGIKLKKTAKPAAMDVVKAAPEKKEAKKAEKEEKVKARVQIIKIKGSKARANPNKNLEWF